MRVLILLIFCTQIGYSQTTEQWLKIEYKNQPSDSVRVSDVDRLTFTDYSTSSSGSVTDIDGNVYHTVFIGNQEWTVENLRVTKYNDGTTIAKITSDNNTWATTTSGAYCAYDNNETNVDTYGYLYNFYAVNTGKLPPNTGGWRVPTDEDWTRLTDFVGGLSMAGTKLKSKDGWNENGNGTDDFCFKAIPGGYRYNNSGLFCCLGYGGYWWSSTESNYTNQSWGMLFYYIYTSVDRFPLFRSYGFSVRLVRDIN